MRRKRPRRAIKHGLGQLNDERAIAQSTRLTFMWPLRGLMSSRIALVARLFVLGTPPATKCHVCGPHGLGYEFCSLAHHPRTQQESTGEKSGETELAVG